MKKIQILRVALASFLILVLSPLILIGNSSSATVSAQDSSRSEIPVVQDVKDLNCSEGNINEDSCGVITLIVGVANVIAGVAGVVIVGMMVWGGIEYSAAGADASKVQAAKQKIFNALLALLLLVFGYSILQWLIPGGVLNGFGYYY